MSREREMLCTVQAALGKLSFEWFVAHFFPVVTGMPYVANRVTEAMIAALQDQAEGKTSLLIINKPPGCGATTILTLFHGWRIARDPSWRSMAASHSDGLAGTTSRRVRRLIMSPEFRRLFRVALREDAATIALWETTANGHFIAVGRDSNVTGRRVNELVCDDLNAAADRHSKAALEHAWRFFNETLTTRVDNDRSSMIVAAQRIAVDDVPGRLIAGQAGWTVVSVPAEDENGEPTAPNVLPRQRLDAIKLQLGSSAYACQYLGKPSDDSTAVIRRAWWRFYVPAGERAVGNYQRPAGCDTESPAIELPDHFDRKVIAADLTFGSEKGDYAAIQCWASLRGQRFLLESFRARVGFEDSLAALEAMAKRHPNAKIIVEKAANGAAVIEVLQKRIPGVLAIKPQGSKIQRASAIAPSVESGSCFLPLAMPGLADFVEELAGATKHDDMLDAAAYALTDLATAYITGGPSIGAIALTRFTPRRDLI